MRCVWANANELMTKYHDLEWGVASYDDFYLFEMLLLESFQAGLSWNTVLQKREYFREAFDNFDYIKISKYDDLKINELLLNKNIIRHKLKIKSAIKNAKVFIEIQKEYGSFSNYIWSYTNNLVIRNEGTKVTTSELSDTISKDLKKKGMSFVGSTIIYSYLEAIGILNNHEEYCFKYEKVL